VAQSIAQRFGPTVLVDAEAAPAATACTSRDACSAPWRAGVWISHNYPFDPVINCTSGFVARPTTGATSGHFFMMTAGHCIWDAGGSGKNWWQGTSANIGNATSTWEYWNYANVDAGIIAITSAQFPTNWAYGNTATDTITGSISSSFQDVGDPVCRAGWAFWKATGVGYQCNTVVATDQTVHDTRHDFYIHHQWQGWLTSKDGDSGGPVMSGHDALGIAAYAAGNSTWYSPIDWISRELGYRPCYTTYSNPCG